MNYGSLPVAKKRKTDVPSTEPPFIRVEFQAPPEWVKLLDAAAEAALLSRSAYLRQAANQKMQEDQRRRGGE
jgi:hypothetical protein